MSPLTADNLAVADLDLKPSALGDTPPASCAYPGCQNGLKAVGRGRPPKWCDEHKGGKSAAPGFTSSKSSLNGRSWPKAAEVETILTKHVQMLGGALVMMKQEADGEVVITQGPAVIHELVELAKTDRGLRKYLEWLTAPGKYAPLVLAVGGLVLPILANHDLLPKLSIVNIPTQGGEQ